MRQIACIAVIISLSRNFLHFFGCVSDDFLVPMFHCLHIYLFIYFAVLSGSQLASSVFSLGTVAVLPFYTLMVVAPNAELVCFLY